MSADPRELRHRRRMLTIVLGMTGVVFVLETIAALVTSSLALLSDAAHVFTDVTGIAVALAAAVLSERPPNDRRTYGYVRLEILAALANAALLMGIGVFVLIEAARRITSPPQIETGPMLLVACVGLVANIVAAILLHGAAGRSVNVRAAYLEVLSDVAGSVAVILAAIVIILTGRTIVDALASLAIGGLIVPRTWSLLRETLDVLLESTPKDVEIVHVRAHILETRGVADVHDLHVWSLTSGMNVVSAHVVLHDHADGAAVLADLVRCLSDDFDIEHSTFQLEDRRHQRAEYVTHP